MPLINLNQKIIEPFCGKGDLIFDKNLKWELYDIEPNYPAIAQDTLLVPPDYSNSTIITNPPFLAKNKTADKTIFNQYQVDDLYKAFLKTVKSANNALIVLPIGFLVNSKSAAIRREVFSNFFLNGVEFFTNAQFETTNTAVCVVYIDKKEKPLSVFLNGNKIDLLLTKQNNYFVGDDWYKTLPQRAIFGRNKSYKLDITAYLLDKIDKQNIILSQEPYHKGLVSDRVRISLTCEVPLTLVQQSKLVADFNTYLPQIRRQYHNLIFSSYREFNRKRLDFSTLFKILTLLFNKQSNA